MASAVCFDDGTLSERHVVRVDLDVLRFYTTIDVQVDDLKFTLYAGSTSNDTAQLNAERAEEHGRAVEVARLPTHNNFIPQLARVHRACGGKARSLIVDVRHGHGVSFAVLKDDRAHIHFSVGGGPDNHGTAGIDVCSD
jgi:hypothetical protein